MLLDSIELRTKRIIPKFFFEEKSVFWIFLIVSLVIGIQRSLLGPAACNNYVIFKTSFFHLVNDQNLYRLYPDEYDDIYLYSPAFALLMAPLAYLSLWLQVILWCCLDAMAVYAAIKLLPFDAGKKRLIMCWLIIVEYATAIESLQAAPIVASCMILAFVFFEKGKFSRAAFFIVLGTFIKIYAIAAVILFLMYPRKLKFVANMFIWTIIFLLAPLLVTSFHMLVFQYHSWINLTLSVHQGQDTGINPNIPIPLSVMGWLKTWFNYTPSVLLVQIIGTVLLCFPFIRVKCLKNINFRLLILASLLIWAMIFNHIAESPSYIVAVLGVAIWFVTDKKDWLAYSLLVLVIVLCVLSPTNIFPEYIREHYVKPYVLKMVPCMLIWFLIQYKLLFKKFDGPLELKS
jgi:hypothetical protein